VQASDFDAVLETHLPSLVHRSQMVGHCCARQRCNGSPLKAARMILAG
jgi:hypothetical protein